MRATLPPPDPTVPVYFVDAGLRKVAPYSYSFSSFAKERWQGRSLLDVYSKEFRDRSREYYEWAIQTGEVLLNNERTHADAILQNGDLLTNFLHRHEPPVVAGDIKIIYDGRLPGNDGETFVIEKPGSMPVHATGRYNFNTLLSILKFDYGLPLVHTVNRLDRLTSGVMVCSLTVENSKKLGKWFGGERAAEGGVKKEYLARCKGRFPSEEIICDEPLLTIDRQIGVNVVHPEGRNSRTIFNFISYHAASDTSVLNCKPITGRSHQIRVHLQFLGYPIANDPVYQNANAWGPEGGRGGIFAAPALDPEQFAAEEKKKQERRDMAELAAQKEVKRVMGVRAKAVVRDQKQAQRRADLEDLDEVKAKQIARKEKREREEADRLEQGIEQSTTTEPYNKPFDQVAFAQVVEQHIANHGTKKETTRAMIPAEPTIFNRSGHLKLDLYNYEPPDANATASTSGVDKYDPNHSERLDYELPLTTAALHAINILRAQKDSDDGWSRWRDMKGVEIARAAAAGGTTKLRSLVDVETPANLLAPSTALPEPTTPRRTPEGMPVDIKSVEEDPSAFCATCYVPLVKDPRPEQLFIWLHALRYTTTEWDWKSEIPYWARESWEMGDTE